MSQQRVLPQSKETLLQSYNKRLKDDIKSIMDNFTEIIKTARIEEETQVSRATQGEQDNYEMHVRAANIVRAGESLMKLVSDLKQFLILNDFPLVNEAINQRNQQLRSLQEDCDKKLVSLRDEISIDLYELEEEYYSSRSHQCSSDSVFPFDPLLMKPICGETKEPLSRGDVHILAFMALKNFLYNTFWKCCSV
ncbi:mediator of RNA polymerase II transcription subunit 22 isoform X3 [Rhinatrema bivittatum]|uniref:mediator of RNA polymerase II transcription subunit 22 isoform X3 n=1 Tax=Rhinatrema bivittatum TaxID=194408 RepID=UPI001125C635|nr:mediator of RNA polymerase II transcription subunit 22 isoform X3 [Rhinatrema bivittatum]